jgi:hypothetical protein
VSESAKEFEGIYTTTFMDAFHSPNHDLVRTVGGVKVVPNRMLKTYLWQEVPRRVQAKSLRLNQKPETIIESDEQTYIGRALTQAAAASSPPTDASNLITFRHVAEMALTKAGLDVLSKPAELSSDLISSSSQNADFQKTREQILDPAALLSNVPNTVALPSSAIFVVGAGVELVVSNPRIKRELLQLGDMKVISFDTPGLPACSLAVGFADGGGVVVAGLADFWATVVVDRGLVLNVSYMPSPANYRRFDYLGQQERIRKLRATCQCPIWSV